MENPHNPHSVRSSSIHFYVIHLVIHFIIAANCMLHYQTSRIYDSSGKCYTEGEHLHSYCGGECAAGTTSIYLLVPGQASAGTVFNTECNCCMATLWEDKSETLDVLCETETGELVSAQAIYIPIKACGCGNCQTTSKYQRMAILIVPGTQENCEPRESGTSLRHKTGKKCVPHLVYSMDITFCLY